MSDRGTEEAIVVNADEKTAVLRFASGQEMVWQREGLPKDASAGTHLSFKIQTIESEAQEHAKLAALILNELLTP